MGKINLVDILLIKAVIIVTLFVGYQYARAEPLSPGGNSFQELQEPTANSLKAIYEDFGELSSWGDLDNGPAHPLVVAYEVRRGGSIVKAIKNYSYLTNTGWARPDSVAVKMIRRFDKGAWERAAFNSVSYVHDEEGRNMTRAMAKKVGALEKFRTIDLYHYGQGNGYGGCGGVAIVDTWNKEFMLLQSCYSE